MIKLALPITCLLFLTAGAADSSGSEVLAKRGLGEVTHLELDAHMARIPEQDQAPFLRDAKRFETMVGNLLMRDQLAARAREAGFDRSELMRARMALAAQNELAQAWLEHYIEEQGEADAETLAREYYMFHPEEFMTGEERDVSHILVSQEKRPREEAEAMALEILEKVRAEPGSFDDLIMEFSEDSSVARNHGHFKNVKRGDMVDAFEEAAFSMAPGELSDLVFTPYGYHIIRVDAVHKPRVREYHEVRAQLEEAEHNRHRERIRTDYLNQLSSQEVEMTEEEVRKMLSRYFSAEMLAQPEQTDSE